MTKRTFVEMVSVEDLNPAGFQPKSRTDLKVIKDLIKSMGKDGFWVHKPITITQDNFIADGHRRWTAAKVLGIKKVPCLRTSQDLETAWVSANDTARKVSGKEWVDAHAHGLRATVTNNIGKRLNYYSDKYGQELINYLSDNAKSTSPIIWAEATCRYLGWDLDENVPLVVKWMVENEMVRKVRYALSEKFPKALLTQKIKNNEPLDIVAVPVQ